MDVNPFSLDATKEIGDASDVLLWIQTSLESTLSNFTKITPDLSKLALVGHSRGGKVVFRMGQMGKNGTIRKVSTIIGLDPVDGGPTGTQSEPPVLTFHESTLNLEVPTLVVGTGLGPNPILPFPLPYMACAPKRLSHEQFFFDLTQPVFHFVAKDYGHTDFVDDVACKQSLVCTCPRTPGSTAPLRDFAGVILVAFVVKSSIRFSSYFCIRPLQPAWLL
jgi:chlorophyllase